jgi:hypothetical protein
MATKTEVLRKKKLLFIDACYADDLSSFLKICLGSRKLSDQELSFLHAYYCTTSNGECYNKDCKVRWLAGSPSSVCRYCEQYIERDDIVIAYSYWSAYWYPSHKYCQKSGYDKEAFDCQLIDASCSDCKFFHRDEGVYGQCLKYDKPVEGHSNLAMCMPCFEHRKNL